MRIDRGWKSVAAWHRRSKFPTEAMTVAARPGLRSLAQARRLVGLPLPTNPVQAGSFASNMGLPPACRKHAKVRPMRPQRCRFPARQSPLRLVNPDRFDKIFRRPCLELFDQEPGADAPATLRARHFRVSTVQFAKAREIGRRRDRCRPPCDDGLLKQLTRSERGVPTHPPRKQKARLVQPGFRFQDVREI